MAGIWFRSRIAVIAAAGLVAVPGIVLAQTRPPVHRTRPAIHGPIRVNGGTWDWRHHEPVPELVERREQASRIAPPPEEQQATTDEVEQLYETLIQSGPQPQPAMDDRQ